MLNSSSSAPVVILIAGLGVMAIFTAYLIYTYRGSPATIEQLGEATLAGKEAIVGALMSVILVLCVVLYGSTRADLGNRSTAEVFGASQFSESSAEVLTQQQVAEWLLDSAQSVKDEPMLQQQVNWAISMVDRHTGTKSSLMNLAPVIRATLWFVIIATALITLIISRRIYGLRVVMPMMVTALLIIFASTIPLGGEIFGTLQLSETYTSINPGVQ